MCLILIDRWFTHQKFLLNMIVIERLKLNKFRPVSIPKNKDLFMRVGTRPIPDMADGQVASFTNGVMDEMDSFEAQVIRDKDMPLAEK